MKGKEMITSNTDNPWDKKPEQPVVSTTPAKKAVAPKAVTNAEYDLEGLMTDFPTAKELERFVFDETGIVLNLKGRANKLKYQVAMDTLNGVNIEDKFKGDFNPYVDKAEMIPVDPLKEVPAKDPNLPDRSQTQNIFLCNTVPHPNDEFRARDEKVSILFRKYKNGMISYECLGPVHQVESGSKIDKYGRTRPEIIKWEDPRTGEQTIVREDGTLTPQGKRLRGMMMTFKVNKSNQWDVWVDRDFISLDDSVKNNPWDLSK
jgi:hypothetical protein